MQYGGRMHSAARAALLALALIGGGSACSSTDPGVFPATRGIIYGTVTNAAGAPVSGIEVVTLAFDGACQDDVAANVLVSWSALAPTGDDGTYRQELTAKNDQAFTGCLQSVARDAVTADTLAAVSGATLRFKVFNREALDSVRVDIQLPE